MKKIFSKIHLWLSVPFGLLITLICFSGAMLVFETEVMELCRRDLYYVEKAGPAPLPMSRLAEKVAATLPDSVSVTGITASSNPERAWQVNLSKPRRASVYVDQYTGEVKGRYERAPFFMTMFRLRDLSAGIGKLATCAGCFLLSDRKEQECAECICLYGKREGCLCHRQAMECELGL